MEKPDTEIESYWFGIKGSMYNFYKVNNLINIRPIDYWSSNLNLLQQIGKYDDIQYNIRQYISLYAIDVIRFNNGNNYHFKILLTNIKRWNKLTSKYSFNTILSTSKKEEINKNNTILNNNSYYNIMYLIIDLYKSLMDIDDKKIKNIFQQIELLLINKDFTQFIKYAIENNKPGLLIKLSKYIDVKKELFNIYDITIPPKMSFKKIINYINGY
jgi:hypothetical protein